MELRDSETVISLTRVLRGFGQTCISLIFHRVKRTDVILEIRRREVKGRR